MQCIVIVLQWIEKAQQEQQGPNGRYGVSSCPMKLPGTRSRSQQYPVRQLEQAGRVM